MKTIIKRNAADIFFIFALIYLEVFFQLKIFGSMTLDFIYPLFFSISIGMILLIACHLFKEKINAIVAFIFLLLIVVLFLIQMMYYDQFKVFTNLYSIFHGTKQVMGFKNEIAALVLNNVDVLIFGLLPLILFVVVVRKYKMNQGTFKDGMLKVIFGCLFYVSGTLCLLIPHAGMEKTVELYLNVKPQASVMRRFGVLTSTRLQMRDMVMPITLKNNRKMILPIPTDEFDEEVNQMNIDFDALIQNETDPVIKNMHTYFSSQSASHKNEYTGMFEGYNLIMITAESFSDYAIDETLTPTLYKMKHEGFDFENFYNPLWEVSTSDGEYVNCMGLYPKPGVWSFTESLNHSLPFTFAAQYQKQGIETFAYHNHFYDYYNRNKTHTYLWKNYKGYGNGLDVHYMWPESDLEMIQKTSEEYMTEDRFHTYFMSVSGHMNYDWSGNSMSSKNRDLVRNLDLEELSKGYLACQIELDRAMEQLLEDLKRYDHLDDTLIVIAPDHYPYGLDEKYIEELSGRKIQDSFDLYKSAMIIYAPSMEEKISVDTICSSIDLLPTVSNLLGLEFDSRLLMGTDIFSDQSPMVILADGSFMNDEVKYDAYKDSVTFMDQRVSEGRIKSLYNKAQKKLEMSGLILDKDYYRKVFNK